MITSWPAPDSVRRRDACRAILRMEGSSAMDKTIDDMTREELAELAEGRPRSAGCRPDDVLAGRPRGQRGTAASPIRLIAWPRPWPPSAYRKGPPRSSSPTWRPCSSRECLRTNGGPRSRPQASRRNTARPSRPGAHVWPPAPAWWHSATFTQAGSPFGALYPFLPLSGRIDVFVPHKESKGPSQPRVRVRAIE